MLERGTAHDRWRVYVIALTCVRLLLQSLERASRASALFSFATGARRSGEREKKVQLFCAKPCSRTNCCTSNAPAPITLLVAVFSDTHTHNQNTHTTGLFQIVKKGRPPVSLDAHSFNTRVPIKRGSFITAAILQTKNVRGNILLVRRVDVVPRCRRSGRCSRARQDIDDAGVSCQSPLLEWASSPASSACGAVRRWHRRRARSGGSRAGGGGVRRPARDRARSPPHEHHPGSARGHG